MKPKITVAVIALAAVFITGCPVPQVGLAPGREAVGGEGQGSAPASGSISVSLDTGRGIAVYTNESGRTFDVTAAEYEGGPQVACVEVSDFTVIPPSTDAEALPVKVIVVGTRGDGNPGVWEIQADDTIQLPQPEQGGDTSTRCIVGGDLSTLPDGLQTAFGWAFKATAASADGKIIVGYAEHRKGFGWNGVQVLPNTRIGVYWRVSKLPFSRFCLVSPPRVIGIFTKPPRPAGWMSHGLTAVLSQLKQFMAGRLAAYIITPESVSGSDGLYRVKGLDDDNLAAVATIDRNTVTSIVELPDLTVSGLAFSMTADALSLAAEVKDGTNGPTANTGSLQFFLSVDALLDSLDARIAEVEVLPMAAYGSSGTLSASRALSELPEGTWHVIAQVTADAADAEAVTTNNTQVAAATLTISRVSNQYSLVIGSIASPDTSLDAGADWPLSVTVTRSGTGTVPPGVKLTYHVEGPWTTPADWQTSVPETDLNAAGAFTDTLSDRADRKLSSLGFREGKNTVTVSLSAPDYTGQTMVPQTAVILVKYPHLVVDTYFPLIAGPQYSGPDQGYSVLGDFNTFVSLYPASDPPFQAKAFNSGTSGRPVVLLPDGTYVPAYSGFGYIDQTGVDPGDYWVSVALDPKVTLPDAKQAYAVRALTAPPALTLTAYDGVLFTQAQVDALSATTDPDPGLSSRPSQLALEDKLLRMVSVGGINWFWIHLP
jgi:hypothetical protein